MRCALQLYSVRGEAARDFERTIAHVGELGLDGVEVAGLHGHAARDVRRWLWVAPAAAVFLLKIVSECATGQMFFGTESLGNIGDPVPLAHAAGTAAAVAFLLARSFSPAAPGERIRSDLPAPSAVHTIGG